MKIMKLNCFKLMSSLLILCSLTLSLKANKKEFPEEFQYRFIPRNVVEEAKDSVFCDTLSFVLRNDELDYGYTQFAHSDETPISIVGESPLIYDLSPGDMVKIEWQLTTLYEAGEGDAPYYSWGLVNIQRVTD